MIIIRLIIQFKHRHLLVYNPLFLLDSCDVVVRKEEGNHTAHLSATKNPSSLSILCRIIDVINVALRQTPSALTLIEVAAIK